VLAVAWVLLVAAVGYWGVSERTLLVLVAAGLLTALFKPWKRREKQPEQQRNVGNDWDAQ